MKFVKAVRSPKKNEFNKIVRGIVKDFDELPLDETIVKPKVGVVGEILLSSTQLPITM